MLRSYYKASRVTNQQFGHRTISEQEHFYEQKVASQGIWIARYLTVGVICCTANTIDVAVACRESGIATIRTIGFRRRSISFSFMLNSIFVCLLGGALGCCATLPYNGLSTGMDN